MNGRLIRAERGRSAQGHQSAASAASELVRTESSRAARASLEEWWPPASRACIAISVTSLTAEFTNKKVAMSTFGQLEYCH